MHQPIKPSDLLTFPLEELPQPGELISVADGVHWLRMPLPIALNHINLWLLEDGDGWTIVDTGICTDETKGLWDSIFEKHLDSKPVKRLIVTHMHPDHIGLAGWLVDKWDIDLWMTRSEYLMCRNLMSDNGKEAPEEGIRFYQAAGFDEDQLNVYRQRFGWYGARITPLPNAVHRMVNDQEIQIGDNKWKVVVGTGHSPEHACLYCEDQNVVIAGDQILPRISSNVSVRPNEPTENPLAEWLDSCRMLIETLPSDILVLPSHGRPFQGAHERLNALIHDHEDSLEKLYGLCEEPQRVVDTFPTLFKGEIGENNLIIAVGESLAHLHYLLAEGRIAVKRGADDVNLYYRA